MADQFPDMDSLQAQLLAIEDLLQARDQQAETQKRAFETLYKEMEQYKEKYESSNNDKAELQRKYEAWLG